MKKVLFAAAMLLATIGIISFVPAKKFADTYTVDVKKSKVDWSGSADNRYHPGILLLKSGSVTIENDKITGAKFVFDLTSIATTDGADGLTAHLKRADFFDVEKFPEATFETTSVTYTSDKVAEISGNLAVKGVSFPLKFPVKVRGLKDGKLFAEAFFTIESAPFTKNFNAEVAAHLFANK